jgi:hypothetical protein
MNINTLTPKKTGGLTPYSKGNHPKPMRNTSGEGGTSSPPFAGKPLRVNHATGIPLFIAPLNKNQK